MAQETTRGPQMERLISRLTDNPEQKLVGFSVTWGDDAEAASTEERAAALNEMLDQGEAQEQDRISVRRVEVRAACVALHKLTRLAQSDITEILGGPSPILDLKHQIREAIGMASALAWQMLPTDEARQIRDEIEATP